MVSIFLVEFIRNCSTLFTTRHNSPICYQINNFNVFHMTLCFSYASGYTMDVIASTAFGLDLDVQETTDHEFIYHAKKFFGLPTDDRIITRIKSFFNILSSCKYL